MQGRLRDSYVEMGNDNQALIAPVGEAFKYSRMADSTINLYSTDNSHPSIAGTYLAACTFYATIFETTPVGLSYTGGLPAAQAAFLQQIAQQTVFDSLSVWNINVFEPQASYTYNTNANNQLEVQFNNTSSNANSYVWNFGDGNGSNDMNPIHTFAADGDYVVTLTVTDGCTETIFGQTISVNLLSNLQEQQLQTLKVIQQNNLLSIVDSNHKPKQITIIDHIGRIVFSNSSMNNSSEQIETSSWSKGIYFVHVIADNSRYTQKIIIL
jgi:PKD repeat protein